MAGTKLFVSMSRLLLLSFPTFIMLSAAVVTEETRRCYWCGPLADQVHRSRRAPACEDSDNYVTACEPGLPYCAVVATSPPYVESRLCVKLYQDECYPLFCNSTKTWKMTCPCRGDLCNNLNTERENEAFDILAKLVAKTRTTRIKKRTQVNTVKFIPSGDEKTVIITNISAFESNELNDSTHDDVTHIMLLDEPVGNLVAMKEANVMSTDITSTNDDMDEPSAETIEDLTAEATEKTIPKPQEIFGNFLGIVQNRKHVDDVAKPSEELPTAEALQQNASPKAVSDKTTVPSTSSYETTYTTTTDDIEMTTKISQGNGSRTLYMNFFEIILCLNIILARSSNYI